MVRGEIDYINVSRTGGFISTEDAEMDVLFIENVDDNNLEVGLKVEFEIVQTSGGPRAKKLQRV